MMDDDELIHPNVIERGIHICQYKATPNLYLKWFIYNHYPPSQIWKKPAQNFIQLWFKIKPYTLHFPWLSPQLHIVNMSKQSIKDLDRNSRELYSCSCLLCIIKRRRHESHLMATPPPPPHQNYLFTWHWVKNIVVFVKINHQFHIETLIKLQHILIKLFTWSGELSFNIICI